MSDPPEKQTLNNPKLRASSTSVVSSIPPDAPDYTDIRNRYFWFIPDENKNYYKEEVMVLDGTSSVNFSPQFRRNSQWSVNSNISNILLAKSSLGHLPEKSDPLLPANPTSEAKSNSLEIPRDEKQAPKLEKVAQGPFGEGKKVPELKQNPLSQLKKNNKSQNWTSQSKLSRKLYATKTTAQP